MRSRRHAEGRTEQREAGEEPEARVSPAEGLARVRQEEPGEKGGGAHEGYQGDEEGPDGPADPRPPHLATAAGRRPADDRHCQDVRADGSMGRQESNRAESEQGPPTRQLNFGSGR